jgi:hypothetical protein
VVREAARKSGEHEEEHEDMLPVRQARTLRRRLPGEGQNKDGYKHKSRTNGKYRSRRDHKSKHKNEHKDERRSRKKES